MKANLPEAGVSYFKFSVLTRLGFNFFEGSFNEGVQQVQSKIVAIDGIGSGEVFLEFGNIYSLANTFKVQSCVNACRNLLRPLHAATAASQQCRSQIFVHCAP